MNIRNDFVSKITNVKLHFFFCFGAKDIFVIFFKANYAQ